MNQHTPGPWAASNTQGPWTGGGDDGVVEAITEDGKYCRREICYFHIMADEDEVLVEDLANARLIASSPDLLAACEKLVEADRAVEDERHELSADLLYMAVELAHDAIRKAKGGKP